MTDSSVAATARPYRLGLVASRFNQFIVDQLIEGANDAMTRHGISDSDQLLVWVPGAFELPLIADQMAGSGQFDAIITLGAVIRGGTPHFEYVAGECARGIGEVALKHGIPVTFGVLTTDTIEQALERAGTGEGNKGFDVTMTAIEMVETMQKLKSRLDQAYSE